MPSGAFSGILRRAFCILLLIAGAACEKKSSPVASDPLTRGREAKTLFENAEKQYHLTAAEAHGAEKQRLLAQAAAAYDEVARKFPDQNLWAAQAMRSLANVRIEQGRVDEGIKLFGLVAQKYPDQSWEVLQAWKTAGDTLWDANRQEEAKGFYKKIVGRFDNDNSPAIYKTVVRGAGRRLGELAK